MWPMLGVSRYVRTAFAIPVRLLRHTLQPGSFEFKMGEYWMTGARPAAILVAETDEGFRNVAST